MIFSRARAFTLMEMLLSISIIGVLTSLAVAGIASARNVSQQLKCKINIRNAGQMAACYAAENKDYFPFAGYARRRWPKQMMPDAVKDINIVMGGQSGLRHGYWSVMFPEQWGPLQFSESLKCPVQPEYDRQQRMFLSDSPFPYYFMSSAMWLEEQAMTNVDALLTAKAKPHHLAEVTYPANKSLFFEQAAFCNTGQERNEALNYGHTATGKISVVFVDLSAARLNRMDGLMLPLSPRGETLLPFDFTWHGVRGRDR